MRTVASSAFPPEHLRGPPLHPDQYPPPPPPPSFHRLSSCDRHPERPITGFCASCLRERLAGLDSNAAAGFSSSSSRRSTSRPPTNSSSAAAALRSALSRLSGQNSSFELRRCRSFSGSRGPGAFAFEPQRRSCDVRGRSTANSLWSLFHIDDRDQPLDEAGEIQADQRPNLGFFPMPLAAADGPMLESKVDEMEENQEEEEEFQEAQAVVEDEGIVEEEQDEDELGGGANEIAVFPNAEPALFVEESPEGINEEAEEPRPMKEHIDLDGGAAPSKKPPHLDFKEIAGSFWLAASVFSKKLQKWRRKQKLKKQNQHQTARNMPSAFTPARTKRPFPRSRRSRETQSEFSEDVFGRRSCDTDPRISLDAGRMSFDDVRFSVDEPRASWDGYLFGSGGGRSAMIPRLPPMLAVVEDAPIPSVQRSDGLIPVEADLVTPGGTLQTREYYSDSSQRRRRSLDRSSSVRRQLVVDQNDTRLASNAKVTPASGNEFFHHVSKVERDFRDSNLNSGRDDSSESLESNYIEATAKKGLPKKTRRWSKALNLLGFIHRRSKGNSVERSWSESWTDHHRNASSSGRFLRSNSSVSSRHSFSGNNGLGSLRRSGFETNGRGKKRRDDFVLERNRSARFSPAHVDNGLLRFYLTPMRSSRRNSTSGKSSHDRSSLFSRNVLRLY